MRDHDPKEWFNPSLGMGLHLFDCYGRGYDDEDLSLYCVAATHADAFWQWQAHHGEFPSGCGQVEVRMLGLPHGVGRVGDISPKSVSYEPCKRAWSLSAPCVYKVAEWVRA